MRVEITDFRPLESDGSQTDDDKVAERLITAIYMHYGLDGVTDLSNLSDWAAKDLFILLEAAGFETDEVVSGRVSRDGLIVNKLCPLKAIKEGRDHSFATG